MNKINLLSILMLCVFVEASAQVLTLDSILSVVEKNNPILRMYDEQILVATNNAEGAKSWMPPSFSSGPWQVPYQDFKEGMWMFSAEQMIPNPSRLKANRDFMLGMSAVEAKGKNSKRNQLFAMVKQAYYEWVVSKKKYAVAVETDSLLGYILRTSELRFTYNREKLNNIYKASA